MGHTTRRHSDHAKPGLRDGGKIGSEACTVCSYAASNNAYTGGRVEQQTCSMKPDRHVIMPGRMRLLRPSRAWLPSSDSTIMIAWTKPRRYIVMSF